MNNKETFSDVQLMVGTTATCQSYKYMVPYMSAVQCHSMLLLSSYGNMACCSKPVSSGKPMSRLRFWIACPDAPLTRLSITARSRRECGYETDLIFCFQRVDV